MTNQNHHRLARCVRRLEELHAWRNAQEAPIREWTFAAGGDVSYTLNLGEDWPVVDLPVRFAAEPSIPREWAGQPVELELWLGGEGFVRLSNGVEGGLDPFHRSFRVTEAAQGGEPLEIQAEVVPKGLFGAHIGEPRLERASLVVPEAEVRALEHDLRAIADVCAELKDHEVVPHLLDLLDFSFASLATDWPSASDVSLTRFHQYYTNPLGRGIWSLPPAFSVEAVDVNRMGRELWSLPPAPRPLEPLPEAARKAVRSVRKKVGERLEEIKQEYPPVGRLALTGHAHIDLAWLWPLHETRRKARRTFSSVLRLMNRYEDFTFNQSSAQLYAWIEEEHPKLFARILERIKEGRWEPVGGSWTEPDCQITGGESFVRQLFYGQRYFQEKFGLRSTVAWLPDAFGFSPAIPQLLRGAGMTGFFTCKLNWNEKDAFPYDLFYWEGIDGSRVTAHMSDNPGPDYNGIIRAFDLLGTWRNFKEKRRHPESLFSFGWGDGGGGPSEKMLENYSRLKSFPALPRLRMTRVEDFYATLQGEDLPRWVGELYLELHRGTLTSQGEVKTLNRAGEHRMLEAEAFSTIANLHGAPYPREELERAWKALLLNQFHDILPGSSIGEVYEDAHCQLAEVLKTATRVRDEALRHLANLLTTGGPGDAVLVANAGLSPRAFSVVLPHFDGEATITDASGEPLPVQVTEQGLLVHDPRRRVPGLGWTTLFAARPESPTHPSAPEVSVERTGDGVILENEVLRVAVDADGSFERVFDKAAGREVLEGRGNQLWAYVDKPREWDAWDIDESYEQEGQEIGGVEEIEVLESGPLRAAVRVKRAWRDSRIVQTYQLLASSRRLDIETHVEWHERQILLRALFPIQVRSHEGTFETMYGVVRRPTDRNTSWDVARFEVSAHRFADLSETGYGVALLNDGKYGHSARDNVLGISLLRSPMHPDPLADEGEHRFTYSLLPHEGDWAEAGVVGEAFALNSPLCVVDAAPNTGGLPSESGLVAVEGVALALGSLKRAEDGHGLILRFYEPHGARGKSVLGFMGEIKRAERINLLEEAAEGPVLTAEGCMLRVEVRPFEVLTLRIELL
jgi:alpha-mannosidase